MRKVLSYLIILTNIISCTPVGLGYNPTGTMEDDNLFTCTKLDPTKKDIVNESVNADGSKVINTVDTDGSMITEIIHTDGSRTIRKEKKEWQIIRNGSSERQSWHCDYGKGLWTSSKRTGRN